MSAITSETLILNEIRVTRVRVGKTNARFTGNGGDHKSYKQNQHWEHKLLVEIEWEPVAGVKSYQLTPSKNRGIDLQHTVGAHEKRFLFCIDQHRLDDFKDFTISGRAGGVIQSKYGYGDVSRFLYTSDPFKLQLQLPFGAENGICAFCLQKPVVPSVDNAPALSEIAPLPSDAESWRVLEHHLDVQSRARRQLSVSSRNRALDHRDVLLCGHSFCTPCMNQYRERRPVPNGQFDVACPMCKDVVKSHC
jgi:hypothetical protein